MLSRSALPYEFRRGQLDMARAVERSLQESKHLIVEAGTGTGKTLAYLLPALRTGQRVIISTGTKNLQEQLFFRDVPFLESLLGPLRVCYMKGRANYLCRQQAVRLARSADSEWPGRNRPVSADRSLGEDDPDRGPGGDRCAAGVEPGMVQARRAQRSLPGAKLSRL